MSARFTLKKIIRPETLRTLAGSLIYERGEFYAQHEKVVTLTEEAEIILAQVQGGQLYEVKLWRRGAKLQYTCNCPFAAEGAFCKHCVAVGLQWVDSKRVE